ELGPRKIRVHPISPGPLKTRAASGLKDFDLMLNAASERAPVGELVDIMDVGYACAYLATPFARRMTGQTLFVDCGVNIMAWAGAPERRARRRRIGVSSVNECAKLRNAIAEPRRDQTGGDAPEESGTRQPAGPSGGREDEYHQGPNGQLVRNDNAELTSHGHQNRDGGHQSSRENPNRVLKREGDFRPMYLVAEPGFVDDYFGPEFRQSDAYNCKPEHHNVLHRVRHILSEGHEHGEHDDTPVKDPRHG